MSHSVASTSNLQISVEPSQSSFFAGEEFSCVITFANTLTPSPQSVPLPSTSTFNNDDNNSNIDRRVVSLGPNQLQAIQNQSIKIPSTSSVLAPHRRKHSKSQSVDIRTFARKNQLQHFGERGEDDLGSDEKYYKNVAEEKERETDEARKYYLHRELLEKLPRRKKLIGTRVDCQADPRPDNSLLSEREVGPSTSTPGKKHSRAFSLAVPGQLHQQHQHLGIGRPEAGFSDSPRIMSQHVLLQANVPSPSPSRNVSSSFRQPSGTIASNHPHSRKKSVAQFQAENLSTTFEMDGDHSPMSDVTPTASNVVTPRESLDLRSKGNVGSSNGFYGLGENSTMESVLREDFTQWSKIDTNVAKTGGKTQSNGLSVSPPFDPKGNALGTENVLWTFAQFGGSFQIDESLIKPGEFEQVKEKLIGTPNIGGGRMVTSPVGGGEFGVDGREDRNVEGWGSYLRGVLSGGGSKKASLSVPSAHRRATSTLGEMRTKTLTSKSIPIFSNPPSMIAVDLKLAPGESRSYTFRIPLPPDLPPSYTGRSISFVYTLTLGTNRLVKTKRGTMEQKSRLVRIPLRVYNLVNISGVTSFFDLTNPIINLKDHAETREEEYLSEQPSSTPTTTREGKETIRRESKAKENASAKELIQYTQHLLASCKELSRQEEDDVPTDVEVATALARRQASNIDTSNASLSPINRAHLQLLPDIMAIKSGIAGRKSTSSLLDPKAGLGLTGEDDDLPKNSLQAVEVLSRNSPKVSYDISKDGQIAAVLTLIKSKYRLGDTVHGVVTMNGSQSIARVVRFAATLESHEEIESTLSTLPSTRAQKMTRVIHSESHENTLELGQVGFQLPIPSGATPDFVTSAVKLCWTVRLSFLMLSSVQQDTSTIATKQKPPSHLIPSVDDGFKTYHCAFRAIPHLAGTIPKEAKLEIVECAVPLTVLAHSTRFTAGEVAFAA